MERLPVAQTNISAEAVAAKVFKGDFDTFAQGEPMAYRGRTVEFESNNIGERRAVFIIETSSGVTAEHVIFHLTGPISRNNGALKLMKDSSLVRVWQATDEDRDGLSLFALGIIPGQEATPEQIADFTRLMDALEGIDEAG